MAKKKIELADLIYRIWERGTSRGEYERETYGADTAVTSVHHDHENECPRFCIDPDAGNLKFKRKDVTHYDFEWEVKGEIAVLKLYQGTEKGEVMYGAVATSNIKRLGKVRYFWVKKAGDGYFDESARMRPHD